MKPINVHVHVLALFLFGVLFTSCDIFNSNDDEEEPSELVLRIINTTSEDESEDNLIYGPISVVIIPDTENPNFDSQIESEVDFGTLEVGESSVFRAVPNMFLVEVNGEPFGESGFGISSPPSDEWVLEISQKYDHGSGDYGYGWSQYIREHNE